MSTSTPAGAAVPRRTRRAIEFTDVLIWAILAILVVVNILMQPTFLTSDNLNFIFSTALVLIFAAVAASLVMLIAEIDLAIGAVLSLVNVIIAVVAPDNALLAIVLAIAVGVTCGLVAGSLVAFLRLPSIIVTLALSTVWGGVALYVLERPGGAVPQQFADFMLGDAPLIACIVLALLSSWFVRTGLGRRVYGLGSDELGAYLSGISLVKTKLAVFAIAGVLLGLAGIALSGVTGAGDPLSGQSYTLTAITAAVLGGVSFAGGRGTIWGAIAGALVLTLITNIVQLSGVSSFYQGIFNGGLLIASLALSRVATGRWLPLPAPRFRKEASDES
jgi:ribose transport system permease protein